MPMIESGSSNLPRSARRLSRRDFIRGSAAAPFAARAARAAPARRDSVLVVGAGLSGLVAAHRLREAGKRVTLIEARDVPGGRVRTLRGYFADQIYAELGAARVAETHEYVLHWVNDLKLSLIPFAPAGGVQMLAIGKERVRADDIAAR